VPVCGDGITILQLVERGLLEALTDAVCLRTFGLYARVIDVLDREIQLAIVPFGVAAADLS